MKLVGLALVVLPPTAAAVWTAHHLHAGGAAGGVYWLIGFAATVLGLVVVAAHYEGQATSQASHPSEAIPERRRTREGSS